MLCITIMDDEAVKLSKFYLDDKLELTFDLTVALVTLVLTRINLWATDIAPWQYIATDTIYSQRACPNVTHHHSGC